ncbi:MAG: insulinase family protein [Rikenellaceae bacterium]|jgi:predicted Zn-dependent peptidase|nr:insulinase family protein [Rikenellaceae bacterium]
MPEMLTTQTAVGARLHTLPVEGDVCRVSFVFRAGTAAQSIPFSASATANLLGEGSRDMSSKEISDRLDFYGSYFGVEIDRDWSVVTFCMLRKFFAPTMDIARRMLIEPVFSEKELATYAAKRKQSLIIERSKPAFKARELFAASLFGPHHPYGVSSGPELYDALAREQIVDFYDRFYLASNCFVVASGAIGEAEQTIIEQTVSGLPVRPAAEPETVEVTDSQRYGFALHEGAVQSALRIGRVLFPRNHPDFVPMQIVATTLGGYFSSRLVKNLREKRGYTYGAYAAMVNMQQAGYLAISTEVASAATDDAIAQIVIETERLRQEKVRSKELQTVKNIMVGEVLRIIDGPFGVADVAIESIQCGEPWDYLTSIVERIRSFTADELLATAQKYLLPERFTIIAVAAEKPKIFD